MKRQLLYTSAVMALAAALQSGLVSESHAQTEPSYTDSGLHAIEYVSMLAATDNGVDAEPSYTAGGHPIYYVSPLTGLTGEPSYTAGGHPIQYYSVVAGGIQAPTISPTSGSIGTQFSVPSYSGVTYQWTLNGSPITGETTNEYTATSTGTLGVTLTPATAAITIVNASTTCPQGDVFNDGCSGADADASQQPFGRTQFFGSSSTGYTTDGIARQSGQTVYARLPAFNVAGVDFGTGYSLTRAGGSLKDPTLLTSQYSGCGWATDSTTGWKFMSCDHVTNLDIENYDFTSSTGAPGQTCITLVMGTSNGGSGPTYNPIKIINNKWKNGVGCNQNSSNIGIGFVYVKNSNNAPIDFERNQLDGDARNNTSVAMGSGATLYTNGSLTVKYNALLHLQGRPIQTGGSKFSGTLGSIDIEDNYSEGMVMSPTSTGIHAEIVGDGRTCGVNCQISTVPLWKYLNNTILADTDMAQPGQGASPLWVNTGVDGDTISDLEIHMNTVIDNPHGGAGGSFVYGTALTYIEGMNVASGSVTDNFMDPGSDDLNSSAVSGLCLRHQWTSSPQTTLFAQDSWLSGNYNMNDNAAQTSWEVDPTGNPNSRIVHCQ